MLRNIPAELQQIPQWVVWRSVIVEGKETKIPFDAKNPNTKADATAPKTWATFDQAVQTLQEHNFTGVGFVLTENDPYAAIDIDDKEHNPASEKDKEAQRRVYELFQSYTERSPSGRGCHIIVKGSVPTGADRGHIGVYSDKRYMTFTGDVIRPLPIQDYNELLNVLYKEMGAGSEQVPLLEGYESPSTDRDVVETALSASNADKFDALCKGHWPELGYPSQSEADFALLSMFAFYTRDNEQVRRLFRMSALGQRDKANTNDRYLNRALKKIRSNEPAPVNLQNITVPTPAPAATTPKHNTTFPPGLVGEIADYIYRSAIRPVPEIALTAAIALTAGICGRSYNISGTGLNQYLILLARTGAGKEGAGTGMDNLVSSIRPRIPMVDQFMGPSVFASGQALIKVLDDRPCFVSLLGEFGLTLQQLCDPRANSAQVMLKRVLLDLYSKSGWNKLLRSTVYSDTDKNTQNVQAPNVTILGESTPETFFEGLDASHIAEGLIPRFSVIEYNGPRPPRNRNSGYAPPAALCDKLIDLVTVSLTTSNNGTYVAVKKDPEALALLDQFDTYADDKMNAGGSDVDLQLWNRAHLKALKMAALVAVGLDVHNPIITAGVAQWAVDFVIRDVTTMSTRFRSGDVGTGETKQHSDLRRVVKDYFAGTPKQASSYGVLTTMHRDGVIPYVYLRRRLANLTSFKSDRRGTSTALRTVLADMVDGGELHEMPALQVSERYKQNTRVFAIGPNWSGEGD